MKKSYRAGGLIINQEKEIVLVKEHLWGLPRGGVEQEESFLNAAKREILEETGLKKFSRIHKLFVYDRYPHGITKDTPGAYPMEIHIFLFEVEGREKLKPKDKGVGEARWFEYKEALEKFSNDRDRRFLEEVWNEVLEIVGE